MTDETTPPSEPATAAGATVLTGADSPPPVPADPKEDLAVEEAAEHGAPPTDEQHLLGEHGAHPTDAQYMLIALGLAGLTAIEVAISYIKGLGDAANPLLIILAATKFAVVVAFFMHLRFDSPMVRRFFVTGIILALIVYTIVFFTLGIFGHTHGVHR
jgi:cytochrome c oxidase subunit 4